MKPCFQPLFSQVLSAILLPSVARRSQGPFHSDPTFSCSFDLAIKTRPSPFLATTPNAARDLCLSNAPSKLIFIVVPDRGTQVVISAILVSPLPSKSSISFTLLDMNLEISLTDWVFPSCSLLILSVQRAQRAQQIKILHAFGLKFKKGVIFIYQIHHKKK
uniref:Uncharacterized protein n=1 Tax=Gossypium raimondii TaxID=29730 RepID=A0A0D2R5P2_GOSRA|nr:hypothetical protein B456_002G138700 [Gossypium raimondii]